jgi:hypothetical protein
VNKNLILILCLNLALGVTSFEFPTHPINLGKWSGGSAISSPYQQINPASIKMSSRISLTSFKIPEDINIQSLELSKRYNNYILKLNTSIIDYGQLTDFITENEFYARDVILGISTKTIYKNLISVGLKVNYLNSKIDSWNQQSVKWTMGLRTHLFDKRLGLGIAYNRLFRQIETNDLINQSEYIFGSFYKPLYFPGIIALDLIKKSNWFGIFSIELNFSQNSSVFFGINSDKFNYKADSILSDIYYGLSSGIMVNWNGFDVSFGIRNSGQNGSIKGISLGKKL